MNQPSHSLALSRVEWNLFATLTFRKERSENSAIIAGERWLNMVSQITSTPIRELKWAMRVEKGEQFGRVHLHLLLVVPESLIGYFVVSDGRASVSYKWVKKRYGISRYRRVVSEGDSVIAYMEKDSDAGADVYELAKTGRAQTLITSSRARRCMRQRLGDTGDERQT